MKLTWLGDHPDRAADQAYDYPFQGTGQIYGASMGYEHILVDSCLCIWYPVVTYF